MNKKDREAVQAFLDWASEEIANGRADGDSPEAEVNAKRIARGYDLVERWLKGGA